MRSKQSPNPLPWDNDVASCEDAPGDIGDISIEVLGGEVGTGLGVAIGQEVDEEERTALGIPVGEGW